MKNKLESPQLKKVHIDDHIKSARTNQTTNTGKRGRPRKNPEPSGDPGKVNASGNTSLFDSLDKSVETSISDTSYPEVVPAYDTTEEAKGFLRAPFDIAAGLANNTRLALYPAQLEAMAPSFKIVYDRRIAPNMGDHADLIAFAMVASGVIFEKVAIFKEQREMEKPKPKPKTDSVDSPTIPNVYNP